MNASIHTKTFKSGNSIAVRLPRRLAIAAGETMIARRNGDTLTLRLIPSATEEAQRLTRFRAMLDELKRIGPVGEIEVRVPFEFPDRPGL
jgi:antitoxin VapB